MRHLVIATATLLAACGPKPAPAPGASIAPASAEKAGTLEWAVAGAWRLPVEKALNILAFIFNLPILAACVGVPLEACAAEEVSALGAAVLAVSAVTGNDVASTAAAMTRRGEVTTPDTALVARYAEIGELQGEIYGRLSDLFPRLQALG